MAMVSSRAIAWVFFSKSIDVQADFSRMLIVLPEKKPCGSG